MINEEFIKSILFPENIDSQKIQSGDFISSELVELMATSTQKRIRECFAPAPERKTGESTATLKYSVEFECESCHSYNITEMGKDQVIYYISHRNKKPLKKHWCSRRFLCDECAKLEREWQEKQKQEWLCIKSANQKDATCTFIKTYCNAGYDFTNPSHNDYRALYNAIRFCDQNKIAEHIREMDYREFLDTPYWKAIARYVKYRAKYKCMLCGKSGILNVHHRNYECHGYELQRWSSELICLCDECHRKHHGKNKEEM